LNVIIEIFNVTGVFGVIILTINMCLNSDFSLVYLLYSFLTLLIVSNIMALFSLVLLIYSLVKNKGSIRARVYYIILNIANLAFIWLLYYFNFLGYKLY
ncbi:serine hydrolase, partial [Clostridium botulinum]|nr:serine hydrolase [Clostridium botulinum]